MANLIFALERHEQVQSGRLDIRRAYPMLWNDYLTALKEIDLLKSRLERSRNPEPNSFPQIECEWCHRLFTPRTANNRKGAKYCQDRPCRQLAHADRKRKERTRTF
jgi:hypothetical protein